MDIHDEGKSNDDLDDDDALRNAKLLVIGP